MEQIFIDKFFVPSVAKTEFENQMSINRSFIKELQGFVRDEVFERTDENGNFYYITMAVWKNKEAIQEAKLAVQDEYKRTGFDMPAMLNRLNIVIDRGIYIKKIN